MATAAPGLARAFAAALSELEQRGIGRKAVAAELRVETSTISRYATGERTVPIESLPAMDRLCGQPLGYVLRLAGYVDDELDVVQAIKADPDLTERYRGDVLAFYEFCRDKSAKARSTSDANHPDADESLSSTR